MKYFHVDVFSAQPMNGNGLTVVFSDKQPDDSIMLRITQEFKQFETIFIMPEKDGCYPVRIYTVEEELGFAGHPLIGAAAVIHKIFHEGMDEASISLAAGARIIELSSRKENSHYRVMMNQGNAEFIGRPAPFEISEIIQALNLSEDDLHSDYPVEVVSTGLSYLLLPLKSGLENAGIASDCFEDLLKAVGAKFVYLFEPDTMECRTWDNSGLVEDVATGSAAGPLCAYLVKNCFKKADKKIKVSQGRYAGRPGIITGMVDEESNDVLIEGDVSFFAQGEISFV